MSVSSAAQLCPTLCNPINCSTPCLPIHHQLPEFTQTHIYRVGDAIQPSHPLSSPSPPAPNPSQHHSLFQWVNSLHEVAKVLEFQLQHHSFERTPRADLLQNGLVGSPCSPWDSQESSPTPQFKSINSLALEEISSLSHSVLFLYFFALTAEKGFLISPCYSLELYIQMGISFLFSFYFLLPFFSQLFVRPPQTPILLFWSQDISSIK